MTHRILGALLSALFLGSCNPLGSSSTITSADGITGLHATFSPGEGEASDTSPFTMTVVWSSGVVGFTLSDLQITGATASGLLGGSKTYTFTLTAAVEGPIVITVPAGVVTDENGTANVETVTTLYYKISGPSVAINRATSQAVSTASLPVNFTAVWGEVIDATQFTAADIVQTGTASGVTWTVTNSGDSKTFTVAATAVTGDVGTLKPTIAAGAVTDVASKLSSASSSTDNTAYYFPQFAKLQLWLRADSLSVGNGLDVNSWSDSSSFAHTLSEATNPPVMVTGAINSLPAVRFSGSRLLKSASGSGITGNPDMTMMVVAKINAVPVSNPAFIQLGESTSNGVSARFGLDAFTQSIFTGFYGGGTKSSGTAGSTFNLFTWVRDSASGTNQSQVGNTQFWNGASAGVTTSFANVAVNLDGGLYKIGQSPVSSTVSADIAEIMVFSNIAMGATERAQNEAYLRYKYSLY